MALNDTLDQKGLTDIFRTLHTKMAEYTFFSSIPGAFSRIDHILGHKSGLKRYPTTEIRPSIFSNHKARNLEVNHKKRPVGGWGGGKATNKGRLSNMLLNEWVKQEINDKYTETNENENTRVKPFGMRQKKSMMEVYSNTSLP